MKPCFAVTATLAALAIGCDRFDAPATTTTTTTTSRVGPEQAWAEARDAMTAVMKAASASTATCVAGELVWEADVDLGTFQGGEGARYVIPEPTHYSRPCIPERCAPAAADLDALRAATQRVKALVDAHADLRVPTFQGFVAMADAMVAFAGSAPRGRSSGLSMHYAALATAYRAAVPSAQIPALPPSLTASLAVEQPGGDPCKGWRIPRLCDVRGVRVPKQIRWRTDPPCVEVEPIRK